MLYLILLPLAVVAAVLLIRQATRLEPRAPDPDAAMLEELRRQGTSLREPIPIRFHMYLPDRAAAERVAAQIGEPGLRAEVSPDATGRGWRCLASGLVVPTYPTLHRLRQHLEALALAERGEYDGWQAGDTAAG